MSLIFISHSSSDAAIAAEVRRQLQEMGHQSIFLDFDPADGIPAGRNWEQELYRNIRSCRAVVVLCSRGSMESRWCFMEITYARALGKHLFPVKIEDCDLTGVLTSRQVVDLTRDGDEAYRLLEQGLLAAGLDPADAFDWDGSRPPYPGLLSFQKEDAAIFFGRGEEIGEGLDLLNRVRRLGEVGWVVVLGASGMGKSSLVRAGLVPRLRRDTESWLVVDPFRPRDQPAQELASVLSRAYEGVGRPLSWQSLDERLRGALKDAAPGPNPLLEMALDLRLESGRSEARVLLVVDQLEELLGHPETHPASRFLALLREAAGHSGSPLLVLGTLRSDFLAVFQSSPLLLGLRFESLSLRPMSTEDVAEVIEGPARVAGIDPEPGLVQVLVDAVKRGNALPLLAFTLRELYERSKAGSLEIDVYRKELGELDGAVAQAAEDLLRSQRLGPAEEDQLRKAFLRMVRVTEEGGYARQPVRWDKLPAAVHPLLEKFVNARLLVSDGDGKDRTIEVAHEALFGSWARLRQWLDPMREDLRLCREIGQDALNWEKAGRAEEFLWRRTRLARARELIDLGVLPLERLDLDFVETAEGVERSRVAAEEARRRRKLWTAAAVTLGALVLAGFAFIFALRAEDESKAAEERARESEVAQERALSAQNFAEYQRVRARAAGEVTQASDLAEALSAIAPKYLAQSRDHIKRARELDTGLAAWRRDHDRQPQLPDLLFSMEVLKARSGGCLILNYGPPSAPRFMLFDGGDNGIYKEVLRPRLEDLRRRWAGDRPLPIDLVVSSQTDNSHLKGLLELMKELGKTPAQTRPFEIHSLWSNAFLPGTGRVAEVIARRNGKTQLVAGARSIGIPINTPFSRLITLPAAGAARVRWDHGLSTTVLGPPVEWIRDFADWWLRNMEKSLPRPLVSGEESPQAVAAAHAAVHDYEILESFESPRIELLPSPIEIGDFPVPGGADRSIPNLASIVLMLELNGKRMLLSADSRADVLFQSLAQAGYVDEQGSMEVDLLVLPHGGSNNNVSVEFFRRVRARHYVVQSNGKFDNPEVETFEMLFKARRDDGQPFTIYLNYPAEEMLETYPIDQLCTLFEQERRRGTRFGIVTPAKGQVSFGIDLSGDGSQLDPGVRDQFCQP